MLVCHTILFIINFFTIIQHTNIMPGSFSSDNDVEYGYGFLHLLPLAYTSIVTCSFIPSAKYNL